MRVPQIGRVVAPVRGAPLALVGVLNALTLVALAPARIWRDSDAIVRLRC